LSAGDPVNSVRGLPSAWTPPRQFTEPIRVSFGLEDARWPLDLLDTHVFGVAGLPTAPESSGTATFHVSPQLSVSVRYRSGPVSLAGCQPFFVEPGDSRELMRLINAVLASRVASWLNDASTPTLVC
jgi:hypothetical protein